MNSIWIDIPEYPKYKISPEGRILSLRGNPKILNIRKKEYYVAVLFNENGRKEVGAHRLVAAAFCEKLPHHTQVNHKDGDKFNNHFSNLEWCTHSENQIHSLDVLGNRGNVNKRVEKFAKLTHKKAKAIRKYLDKGISPKKLAKYYGVGVGTISLIKLNKIWKDAAGVSVGN